MDAEFAKLLDDTVPRYFWAQVALRGAKTAMREKDFGIWKRITWAEYGERARATGLGLAALGLRRGDIASVIAENCPEWLYTDMGVQGIGGVTNGIYTTDAAKQVEYVINDSGTRFFFAENEEQLDKVLEVRDRCPSLAKIIVYDMEGLKDFADPMVMSFDALMALGRTDEAIDARLPDAFGVYSTRFAAQTGGAVRNQVTLTTVNAWFMGSLGFDPRGELVPERDIQFGGPPRDGIPAIDRPEFVPANEAGFLTDRDRDRTLEQVGLESRAHEVRAGANVEGTHTIVKADLGDHRTLGATREDQDVATGGHAQSGAPERASGADNFAKRAAFGPESVLLRR